jgi:site-specific DNA-methyltransferase (adenine-specific)
MPGVDVFLRFNEGVSILQKVVEVETGQRENLVLPAERQFMRLVSPRRPFGPVPVAPVRPARGRRDVTVFQAGRNGSMKRADVPSGLDMIDKWKVFVGFLAPGTGNRDSYPTMVISTPFLGAPGTVSAETYLRIGGSDSRVAAESIGSYLACRFTRFLILLHKPSQNTTRRVYTFVPTQDWSNTWTDDALYEKYGLTDEEIAFIEKVVRPMEFDTDVAAG